MKQLILSLALTLFLAGCGGSPPVPTDHYYRLPAAQGSGEAADLASGPIYVERLTADGVLMERALAHTEAADDTQLMQHHYHHWVDSPTRMVRDHLIDFLRGERAAPVVANAPTLDAELSLFGKIRRFEIIDSSGADEVVVELEFRVERAGTDAPVLVQQYQERVPAAADSMNACVDAFGTALSRIYSRLAADIRSSR